MHPSATETAELSPEILREVLAGLRARPRSLPAKLFYDALGSQLFEQICELPEYYVTRTELALLEEHGVQMAARVGGGALFLELGTGSGIKTRLLLDHLETPAAYVAVDLAAEALAAACDELRARYPRLLVVPEVADFSRPFSLPQNLAGKRTVVFFPGSTIGNFPPTEARALLTHLAGLAEGLLLGFDLKKDPSRLHAAYNDAQGITAAFNLNLLVRLNREAGATFAPESFFHYAPYNPLAGRIEMYLVSRRAQTFEVAGERFTLEEGEAICTEWSAKYTVPDMEALAASAGWRLVETWTDVEGLFAVGYFAGGGR
jgi:dimethylhistidine N-methyltransferase